SASRISSTTTWLSSWLVPVTALGSKISRRGPSASTNFRCRAERSTSPPSGMSAGVEIFRALRVSWAAGVSIPWEDVRPFRGRFVVGVAEFEDETALLRIEPALDLPGKAPRAQGDHELPAILVNDPGRPLQLISTDPQPDHDDGPPGFECLNERA